MAATNIDQLKMDVRGKVDAAARRLQTAAAEKGAKVRAAAEGRLGRPSRARYVAVKSSDADTASDNAFTIADGGDAAPEKRPEQHADDALSGDALEKQHAQLLTQAQTSISSHAHQRDVDRQQRVRSARQLLATAYPAAPPAATRRKWCPARCVIL